MTSHPHASSYSQDYFKKVLVVIFTRHIVDLFLFIFLFFLPFQYLLFSISGIECFPRDAASRTRRASVQMGPP